MLIVTDLGEHDFNGAQHVDTEMALSHSLLIFK
jgi:hypothetical protein